MHSKHASLASCLQVKTLAQYVQVCDACVRLQLLRCAGGSNTAGSASGGDEGMGKNHGMIPSTSPLQSLSIAYRATDQAYCGENSLN